MNHTTHSLALFLRDIRLAHTVFALPFIVAATVAAVQTNPHLYAGTIVWKSAWILTAAFAARTVAMGFNRIADAKLDALNPRTASRPLPAGRATRGEYALFVGAAAALFVLSAAMLNSLAFLLSPLVLAVLCGYSLTKRFTAFTQPMLGASLALGPLGAWIAITGAPPGEALPLYLAGAVFFWVWGFDLIYACQDLAADAVAPVRSFPKRYGIRASLLASTLCHLAMLGFLVALWLGPFGGGVIFGIGLGIAAALVVVEHAIVRPSDLRRVGTAFFHLNALLSVVTAAAVIAHVILQ